MSDICVDFAKAEYFFGNKQSTPVLAVSVDELENSSAILHFLVAPYNEFTRITHEGPNGILSSPYCYSVPFSEVFLQIYDMVYSAPLRTAINLFYSDIKSILLDNRF